MPLAARQLLLVCWTALVLRGLGAVRWTAEDTSQPNEFQIAFPVVWDGEQNEHIPLQHLHSVWRHKRSLRATPTLNINLTVFGNDFHLEVWENKELLAPGFKVYHRHPKPAAAKDASRTDSKDVSKSDFKDSGSGEVRDGVQVKDDGKTEVHPSGRTEVSESSGDEVKVTGVKEEGSAEVKDDVRSEVKEGEIGVRILSDEEVDFELSCQMTGRVRSHGDTPVALSVCQGMKGIIRTVGEDYIIEPIVDHVIPDHVFNQQGDQSESNNRLRHHLPHRVYRRSAVFSKQHQGQFCGAGNHGSSERQKRSSSGFKDQMPPPSSSSSTSSSSPVPPSSSSIYPDATSHFQLRNENKKHHVHYIHDNDVDSHVHYIHDNDVDSIFELPSSTVDQLTKMQQFLLRENNDFREVDMVGDNNAVPFFTAKGSDPQFREQSIKNVGKNAHTNSKDLGENNDASISPGGYGDKNSVSDFLETNDIGVHATKTSDFDEHGPNWNSWPYLTKDETELTNMTSSSEGRGVEGDAVEEQKRGKGRDRRSLTKWKYLQRSGEKTMEMLVVVDKSMMDRHGNKNVTTYTLTLFNMVSKLFQDASLGSRIHVVLVGLVLLEGDERGLSINHHADKTLNSFCSWQSVLLGDKGRQHDHAVLLSATDFCSYKNSPCDTLGFAPIGGMCNQIRSCTINEDTGLNTALTIAHEIGHNFGMLHDGEGNYCRQTVGSIMAPTLVSKDGTLQWSVCSRAYLLRFLNTPQSVCLDDKSTHVAELKFPDQLPGQLYDADVQCKWQFGSSAQLCQYDFGKDTCKALWCYRGNKRCETKFLPAAEGTSCGVGKWCRDGRCVRYGRDGPGPVNGAWSHWGEWSQCTRTCGKGVQARERECNRPLPQYGGRSCHGGKKQHKLCNVQDCPASIKEDFHSAQCSQYDKKPFRGWYMHWKPYKKLYDVREPCKLYCLAETLNYIFTIKHVAMDGTTCSDTSDICIEGSCQKVGCDWVINSTAITDICGVCKGDNSSCQLISGEYSQQPQLNTYFPIVVLPKGARHIRIKERSISSNYLAIRNIYGQYYLNGDRRVAWPGIYTLGGASFQYKRPYNEPETLDSSGPLGEDIILEILVQDGNPGIDYEYTIPRTERQAAPPADNFTWSQVVSACSQSCAGGLMAVSARCLKNLDTEVDAHHCDPDNKPKTGVFPCKQQPCPARWVPEPWTECSKTCGGGRQTRKMLCRQQVAKNKDRKLRKKLCKHLAKPATRRRCSSQECPPEWHARWVPEEWSQCSRTCGGGKQVRKITCRKRVAKTKERRIGKRHCKPLPKPAKRRHCNTQECPPDWHTGRWSKCSVQCGEGSQMRKVSCRTHSRYAHSTLPDQRCNNTTRPSATRICRRHNCQTRVTWRYSAWTECTVTCGEGQQERKVWCSDGHSQHSHRRCAHLVKPPSSQTCTKPTCPTQAAPQMARMVGPPLICEDKEKWCHLVKEHNACGHSYYRESCCKTCHGSITHTS